MSTVYSKRPCRRWTSSLCKTRLRPPYARSVWRSPAASVQEATLGTSLKFAIRKLRNFKRAHNQQHVSTQPSTAKLHVKIGFDSAFLKYVSAFTLADFKFIFGPKRVPQTVGVDDLPVALSDSRSRISACVVNHTASSAS